MCLAGQHPAVRWAVGLGSRFGLCVCVRQTSARASAGVDLAYSAKTVNAALPAPTPLPKGCVYKFRSCRVLTCLLGSALGALLL